MIDWASDHLAVEGLGPRPVPVHVWVTTGLWGEQRWEGTEPRREGPGWRVQAGPVVLHLYADEALRVEVEATEPVLLRQVALRFGVGLPLLDRLDRARWFQQGYQSWSRSGAVPATRRDKHALIGSFDLMNRYVDSPLWGRRDGQGSSHFFALRDEQSTLVGGFIEQRHAVGQWWLRTRGQPALIASLDHGGRRLFGAERLRCAPIGFWQGDDALDAFTRARAKAMDATVPARSPVGWCSWYQYKTGITAQLALQNLEKIELSGLPIDVFQLDDGWQTAVGDWQGTNGDFPDGLAPLAHRARQAGMSAGIWLAPFFATSRSHLFKEHPERFLRDRRGRPLYCGFNPMWRARTYALDLTHPEVGPWLAQVFEGLAAQGYDYFKIDFLFAGLRVGQRHDPRQSPVEAWRAAVDTIRQAIGPEAFLLGCGAPLGPSVGLFDAMRVSEDVEDSWASWWIDRLSQGATYPSARGALRQDIARSPLHRRWWLNDPDCLLLPKAGRKLSPDEVRLQQTVLAMSGGMILLSDDMGALDEAALDAARAVLPPSPLGLSVPGLLDQEWPERLEVEGEGRRLVALVNWSARARDVAVHDAFDHWEEHPVQGQVTVPPHGVRLLLHTPQADHPQAVGASWHPMALVDGRVRASWDGDRLRVNLHNLATTHGRLWVRLPAGWSIEGTDGSGIVAVELDAPGEVELRCWRG